MTDRMWYIKAVVGDNNDTTYMDGYVLSPTRPSAYQWMREGQRLPKGYKILETSVQVCPVVNPALIDNKEKPCGAPLSDS